MPPQIASLILLVLEELGVRRSEALATTGMDEKALGDADHRISYRDMLTLIERALALAPLPGLGLRVGHRENIGTWGALGYAVMSCASASRSGAQNAARSTAAPS